MKHNRLLTLSLALPAALLLIWFSVHASSETVGRSAPPNTLPSGPSDWPQWRGPERNGVSKDTGLIKQWPSSGPQRVWSISSLGEGYGSRSEEHTSELQSLRHLVCRLLLEEK